MRALGGLSGSQANALTPSLLRMSVLAAIYVSAVLAVTRLNHLPALAMSFASSAVLLATQPDTIAARPRALIGGHMIAGLCGWASGSLVGDSVTGAAIAIGAAAILMQATRTLHPPAAVSAYMMLQQPSHWTWLLFPVLFCAILLSVLARVAEQLTPLRGRAPAGSTQSRRSLVAFPLVSWVKRVAARRRQHPSRITD